MSIRLVAEDNVPATRLEQAMQGRVDIATVRTDMDATHLPSEKINEGREDQNLGLLDVGFEIIHVVEWTEQIPEGNAADELDLGFVVVIWHQILHDAGRVVQQQVP